MFTTLTRTTLWECSKTQIFYCLTLLVVVSAGLIGQLVARGANALDALMMLPGQLAFPASIIIPLALTAAIIATLGRMRDDGEMTALQAAGVSSLRVVWGLTPLLFVNLLVVGALSHLALPKAYQQFRETKTALLRQAIAAKVARQQSIFSADGLSLAASGAHQQELSHVFIRHRDETGRITLGYAPQADWRTTSDSQEMSLQLGLQDFILLSEDHNQQLTSATIPYLRYDLSSEHKSHSHKPDAKESFELARLIPTLRQLLGAAHQTDQLAASQAMLMALPARITQRDIVNWSYLRHELIDDPKYPRPLRNLLSEEIRQIIDQIPSPNSASSPQHHSSTIFHNIDTGERYTETGALDRTLHWLNSICMSSVIIPPAQDPMLASWQETELVHSSPALRRLLLLHHLGDATQWDLSSKLWLKQERSAHAQSESLKQAPSEPDKAQQLQQQLQQQRVSIIQKELRGHELAWHLRWVLPLSCITYLLVASSISLSIPSRSRLIASGLALGVVIIALLPAFLAVKGLRGNLGINPGWIFWLPQVVMLVVAIRQCWRKR